MAPRKLVVLIAAFAALASISVTAEELQGEISFTKNASGHELTIEANVKKSPESFPPKIEANPSGMRMEYSTGTITTATDTRRYLISFNDFLC